MIKAIVTDIEGTTSSLSFVKEVLFPYARARLANFIAAHGDEPLVSELLQATAQQAGIGGDRTHVVAQLLAWCDADVKATPLKALQGMIWESGYQQQDFYGHVYADAVNNLKAWKSKGMDLYVYSSGSVHAQKLLFAHTEYGDLTPLFSGYFDTHVGGKRESAAYTKIADQIGVPPASILFLSDIKEELDAARCAGFKTCWLVRDALPDHQAGHPQVCHFDAIDLELFD